MYSDGGSRGNPGKSAGAFLIFDTNNNLIKLGGKFLGISTNNMAEYEALLFGLKSAQKLKIRDITCFLDSELVVQQLNGKYKISNLKLKEIYEKIISMKNEFKSITFSHVKRESNMHADSLVNIILDANAFSNF